MPKTEPTVGRDREPHVWIYQALDAHAAPGRPEAQVRDLAAPMLDETVRTIAVAYAVDAVTDVVRDLGERYVMAINAVLCAPSDSTDVERWRGHAESARTIAQWWVRQFDLDPSLCAFGTTEWRAANGVYSDEYLASLSWSCRDALTLAPEGFDDDA